MTEIELHRSSGSIEAAQYEAQDRAVQRLGEWAESARAAHTVAEHLVQTSFVPEGFRNKPHEATAAILSGLEVGLSPMAALRSFDVIQGTAAPRAVTLRAIVQSRGHEMEVVESTNTRCKMRGRRKGSSQWQEVIWTAERAKQLGLTNKHNWKAQPQAMLVARATSELARLIAADAILGIAHTVEELTDEGEPTPTVTAQRQTDSPRRTAQRKLAPAPEPEPEPPLEEPKTKEPVEGEVVDDEPEEPITSAQSKKMHASFNEAGITDRAERMAYVVDVIGHDVDSSKNLTKHEASLVIEALIADLDKDQQQSDEPTFDEADPWAAQS